MYRLPRNMLQYSLSFRSTKITVLNIGDTSSYVFLKSNNKFFFSTVRLLDFLADFFTAYVKLHQLKLML